ncbi:MAG: HD domain-containing protein [Candidatus Promineifilaceae bacterium]|nr:HD domain-containing protein [Candidatus Promineifilaceae bacterium]
MVRELGATYRFAQFWWALTAKDLQPSDRTAVKTLLSENEWQLFEAFSPADRRHAYQVYATLMASGYDQNDLLVAGVLHDVGKTRVRLTALERILVVLVGKLFPDKLAAWGKGSAAGWRRPFVAKQQHPQWGAQMVEEAGSSALVVNLVRRHQDPLPPNPIGLEEQLLCLLQWADDQN